MRRDTELRFERDPQALWRDGPEIAVVLGHDDAVPQVLSGAAVDLWRSFEQPSTLAEVAATVARATGRPQNVVQSALAPVFDGLVASGALRSVS